MRAIIGFIAIALTVGCGSDGKKSTKGTDAGSSGGNGSDNSKGQTSGACPTAISGNPCLDGCNPCSRLSDAQVAAVTGMPGVMGQWDSDACLWDYNDAEGDISFEVGFHINTDYGTFQDECHSGSAPDQGITVTAVSGVGDDACYITTPVGALGSFDLEFLKGCFGYSISISGPVGHMPPFSDATTQDYEKKLALDVVPNL